MTKPILFDIVRAQARSGKLAKRSIADQEVTKNLLQTIQRHDVTPFVIDDETIRLALKLRSELIWNPTHQLIDAAGDPPFTVTWIEYDPRAKLEEWRQTPDVADHFGHLVFRERQKNGLPAIGVLTIECFKNKLYVSPYTYHWYEPGTKGEVAFTWGHPKTGKAVRNVAIPPAEDIVRLLLLCGSRGAVLPAWAERVSVDLYMPHHHASRVSANKLSDEYVSILTEHGSSASLLMAIMALMSHCPRNDRVIQPSGRWVAVGMGGGTRPFNKHTVVRIETTPRIAYQQVRNGMRVPTGIKHAEHDVRGHWRVIRRGKHDEYAVFVKAHKRGDPALGTITHDHYETVTVRRQ